MRTTDFLLARSAARALCLAALLVALPLAAAVGPGCGGDGSDGAADTAPADTTADTGAGDTGAGDTGVADTASPDDAADTGTPPGDVEEDTGPPGPPIDGRTLGWPGWDNATVYFVITDRFFDGDPTNNQSYGRQPDGVDEVGTFHGGDLAGLTQKLDEGYFLDLGVSAIWITPPYEQVHGWVVGGSNGFKHYGYHGYFGLDWTRVDRNYGTEADMAAFVDTAHDQGIRVVMDVVMNHPGYATAADLAAYGVDVLDPGWEDATLENYYDFFRFNDPAFADWWGPSWVRAQLGGGYQIPGNDDLTKGLTFLPDFKTEATAAVGLPPFLTQKADTLAVPLADTTVRGYLVAWLTGWVRTYGIDGFRCDTAKHVEKEAWAELEAGAQAALAEWRAANPDKAFPDADYPDPSAPFWMTGEVFPHGVVKDAYFDNGFDSLINFDYQNAAALALDNPGAIDATWTSYANAINGDPDFNVLSYLSSHDTSLFFDAYAKRNPKKQRQAAALLLLAPGAVQIFYGDESSRLPGKTGGDPTQGTRSDYVWGANADMLAHWQRIGVFRKKHRAVGAGAHQKVGDAPYAFKRSLAGDVVYVALGATGTVTLDVSADFADGTTLRDAYTGATAEVAGGVVSFEPAPDAGVVLVEAHTP